MGIGDEIMATGLARGAAERGRRIAFGDGRRIIWGPGCTQAFKCNPNIAPPGSEGARDVVWIKWYRGNREYAHVNGNRWQWKTGWRAPRGELFFDAAEIGFADAIGARGYVVIEPRVPRHKRHAPNKQWPRERYGAVARRLLEEGHDVRQLAYGAGDSELIAGVTPIETPTFRHAAAALSRASLYVGGEGGLHHAAAALGVAGVVIFGAWISPKTTGYDGHTNIAVGDKACGRVDRCEHCIAAMRQITVDQVVGAARKQLAARARAA